jgi:hypothetical protein
VESGIAFDAHIRLFVVVAVFVDGNGATIVATIFCSEVLPFVWRCPKELFSNAYEIVVPLESCCELLSSPGPLKPYCLARK